MFDITQAMVALILLVAAIVGGVVIPLIRSKLGLARWNQLITIAGAVVLAAEQLGMAGIVKDKLAYAMERVQATLRKQGLTFDSDTVRAAIEAVLYSEINKDKRLGNVIADDLHP